MVGGETTWLDEELTCVTCRHTPMIDPRVPTWTFAVDQATPAGTMPRPPGGESEVVREWGLSERAMIEPATRGEAAEHPFGRACPRRRGSRGSGSSGSGMSRNRTSAIGIRDSGRPRLRCRENCAPDDRATR